jgi:hypothetical protein
MRNTAQKLRGADTFVIGRKYYLFCDTVAGANASAYLYSLIETAKGNGIESYTYLRTVFTELPQATSVDDVEALLPAPRQRRLCTDIMNRLAREGNLPLMQRIRLSKKFSVSSLPSIFQPLYSLVICVLDGQVAKIILTDNFLSFDSDPPLCVANLRYEVHPACWCSLRGAAKGQ